MSVPVLEELTAREMLHVLAELEESHPDKLVPHSWVDKEMQGRSEFLTRCLTAPASVLLAAEKMQAEAMLAAAMEPMPLRTSHPESEVHSLRKLDTTAELVEVFKALGVEKLIPLVDSVPTAKEGSYLGRPVQFGRLEAMNACLIQPMENVSCNTDGTPRFASVCRYVDFGCSGAGTIWGEASSVREDGRASPFQLQMTKENEEGVRILVNAARDAHAETYGRASSEKLLLGAQLTYSGRNNFEGKKVMFNHPVYEDGFMPGSENVHVLSDAELDELVKEYVEAAKVAARTGYNFVDVKACHGYLLHESLGAFTRENSKYGGKELEKRANLLLTIVKAIKAEPECADLEIGVRLSIFDSIPLRYVDPASGELTAEFKEKFLPYNYAFGVNPEDPHQIDLSETTQLIGMLKDAGVSIVNCSAGNPYQTFNAERPANRDWMGLKMPYDALLGVATLIEATRQLQVANPDMPLVSSGTSALEHFLPNVMEAALQGGYFKMFGSGKPSIIDLFWPERFLVHGDAKQLQARDERTICVDALACVGYMRQTAQMRKRIDEISSFCVLDGRWQIWGKEFITKYNAFKKAEKKKVLAKLEGK